ncbi:MAG: prepilin peptidase [Actinobacteria bacterium]|nr:prepilin peptidase [Actinomycetota bacterium]
MDLKIILICAAVFAAGFVAGSFLNILIYKLPRKLKVFSPYPVCYYCSHKTHLLYTFPALAYLFAKNKCGNCFRKLSLKSIAPGLLNGALWAFAIFYFMSKTVSVKNMLEAISAVIFISTLIVVSFIDWQFMIIPNIIVLPLTLVGLALSTAAMLLTNPSKWWFPLVFCAGAFAFMLIVHLIYPRGMGMGDVKLALMMGAFLVKDIIAALFFGFLAGAIAGIIFMISRKKTLKQFIPFGPFMSAGGILAIFFGNYISGWYTGFF